MSKLEGTLIEFRHLSVSRAAGMGAVPMLVVTLIYTVAVLTVPLDAPERLIWFAIYPILQSEISGIGFGRILRKSLWVLPLVLMVGIFNPILDRTPAFEISGFTISRGMLTLTSILLRGLLSLQALLLLTYSVGIYEVFGALRRLGVPRVLVVQLQFMCRYIGVILEEALGMERARVARGFGRKNYPLKMWARITGQLLLRSYERARRIHAAMLARGFDGSLPSSAPVGRSGVAAAAIWIAVIILLRILPISELFAHFF